MAAELIQGEPVTPSLAGPTALDLTLAPGRVLEGLVGEASLVAPALEIGDPWAALEELAGAAAKALA